MPINIGVIGGTFDPIHQAHLHIALKSQTAFNLQQVYFVVAQTPPHKQTDQISNVYHRFAMVCLALSDYPALLASSIELEAGASPYTVDTLDTLSRQLEVLPRHLFFIAGGDSFQWIRTWKDYERLLRQYNVLFVERPGFPMARPEFPPDVQQRVFDVRRKSQDFMAPGSVRDGLQIESGVYLLDLGAPAISSTSIRRNRSSQQETPGVVPERVERYLIKHRLYVT